MNYDQREDLYNGKQMDQVPASEGLQGMFQKHQKEFILMTRNKLDRYDALCNILDALNNDGTINKETLDHNVPDYFDTNANVLFNVFKALDFVQTRLEEEMEQKNSPYPATKAYALKAKVMYEEIKKIINTDFSDLSETHE